MNVVAQAREQTAPPTPLLSRYVHTFAFRQQEKCRPATTSRFAMNTVNETTFNSIGVKSTPSNVELNTGSNQALVVERRPGLINCALVKAIKRISH